MIVIRPHKADNLRMFFNCAAGSIHNEKHIKRSEGKQQAAGGPTQDRRQPLISYCR